MIESATVMVHMSSLAQSELSREVIIGGVGSQALKPGWSGSF